LAGECRTYLDLFCLSVCFVCRGEITFLHSTIVCVYCVLTLCVCVCVFVCFVPTRIIIFV
jgi:hypothetical protein